MKTTTLIITGILPSLNEYISAMNNNRYCANQMKKTQTERVMTHCLEQKIPKMKHINHIFYHWICPNKKKDKDNISFSKKFINDGLQSAGIIPNDGWNSIDSFRDEFSLDSKNPRIEVEISY